MRVTRITKSGLLCGLVLAAVAAASGPAAAFPASGHEADGAVRAVSEPPPPSRPDEVSTLGLYLLNSRFTGDPNATRGWDVFWQVPELENFSEAWGAVGQWYFNLESGFYKSPDGWGVYYFGDDNGLEENNPDCGETWSTGGICGGDLGDLQPGQTVRFVYQWCDTDHNPSVNGSRLCLWVDMLDGNGLRFLAEDERSTVEMYAHDIETFADSGSAYPEPIVSCTVPTRMLGQYVQGVDGTWTPMTGASTWNFEDNSDRYRFLDVDTDASPAHWSSCSE